MALVKSNHLGLGNGLVIGLVRFSSFALMDTAEKIEFQVDLTTDQEKESNALIESALSQPQQYLRVAHAMGHLQNLFNGKSTRWLKVENNSIRYFFSNSVLTSRNGNVFLRVRNKSGFSYDFSAPSKLALWYGAKIGEINWLPIFEALQLEWTKQLPMVLLGRINKTMVAKVLGRKITNPETYAKTFLKMAKPSLQIVSAKLFLSVLKENALMVDQLYHLLEMLKVAKDPNYVLYNYKSLLTNNTIDTVNQAKALQRIINFKWSTKRMEQVHAEWTREITAHLISFLNPETIAYEGILHLPEGWKLLTTNEEVLQEGTEQSHCLFSNYYSSIREYKYFAIRVEEPRCTIGITIGHRGNYIIQQVTGKRNKHVAQEFAQFAREVIARVDCQQWFSNNCKVKVPSHEYAIADDLPF